jgi:predicted O-linked N-acetylglucosamine transferase (SPINDLY family)
VVPDSAAFLAMNIALATDLQRLASFRASARGRMEQSPLLDARGLARNLEQAYLAMLNGTALDVCRGDFG